MTPAHALQVELVHPEPTPHGEVTAFALEFEDPAGAVEVRWDFGDGSTSDFSTTTSAEHSYETLGHYTVSALLQDESGFASASFIHTVYTPPTPGRARCSSGLLYVPERELVVTANTDNDTITLVDAESLQKSAEIAVFQEPVALALAPDGRLWVLHREDYALGIVDLDERKVVDFFRLPYASQPAGLVFGSDGTAYVALSALGEVLRIDGESHEIVGRRLIAPSLFGISVSGDGADLWLSRFISQGDHAEVYRLDAPTLQTVVRYDLMEDLTTQDSDVAGRGLANYLFSVALSPDGTRAWVPSKKDNVARGLMRDGLALTQDNAVRPLVSILDLVENEEIVEQRIDLDDRNLPRHVTFSELGDWAFVSVFGSDLVELRDAFDQSFVTALRADEQLGPVASVMLPGDRLAVLADLSRSLVVYDVGDLMIGVDQSTRLVAEIALVERERLSPVVLRGKQLFANAEDKRMASEGYLSCSSCHFEGNEDGRVWDFFDRGEGFRNTISLLGRRGMGHGRVHWSGNFDEIQDFEGPIRAHQGGLGFLSNAQFDSVSDPLGEPKAGLDVDLDALAAYVASLETIPQSPYRNPDGSLTEDGRAGRALFLELGCDGCHSGEDFTDSARGMLHDVGTLTESSGLRLGGELTGIDTPTLLGIWQTAPYLHDGSAATLLDVLTTRNPDQLHGETAALTEQELDLLVSYLLQIDLGRPAVDLVLPEAERPSGSGGGAGAPMEAAGGTGPGSSGTGGDGAVVPDAGVGGVSQEDVGTRPDAAGCRCALALGGGPPSSLAWGSFLGVCLALLRRRGRARVLHRRSELR